MDIFEEIDDIKYFKNSIVTIGVFDGLHLGHRKLLNKLVKVSKLCNTQSVVVTFNPHPREVLTTSFFNNCITPIQTKINLFKELGIENVLIIPFDKEFSNVTARAFTEDIILNKFKPLEIILGSNHHFGKNRQGDIVYLNKIMSKHNVKVTGINQCEMSGEIISSTIIRKMIKKGDMESARIMLSDKFSFNGTIVKGDGRGKTLNFPTANIKPCYINQLIPKKGVYSVNLVINGIIYKGMCNIGTRPTFNSSEKELIEVHVFNLDDVNLYNEKVKLIFNKYIRREKKFNSKESLIEQLKIDRQICQTID